MFIILLFRKPLDERDAREIAENYLRNMRNPNLKFGNMKDAGSAFEADIVTKDNSLLDKVQGHRVDAFGLLIV